jgi:copper chaperone CopZ
MKTVSAITVVLIALIGCADSNVTTTDATKPEATAVAFNVAGAPTVQFEVPDMMCEESCAKAVRETLAAQPGAKEVVVDFPKKIATVAIDAETFSSDDALAALLDKQFTEAKLVAAPEKPAAEPEAPASPDAPKPTDG